VDTQANTHIVLGAGNPNASIVIVNEAPNELDSKMGQIATGAAGDNLKTLLAAAGIDRRDTYITNVCKCWPWKIVMDKFSPAQHVLSRPPERDEIKACSCYLQQELQQIRPKIIIALGSVALSALEGRVSKITERMGVPSIYKGISDKVNRTYIMPTLHPAYIWRNGGINSVVATQTIEHLKFALQMRDNKNLFLEHQYTLIDSKAKLLDMLGFIKKRKVMSFDIETEGLEISDRILGIGFGMEVDVACYVPFLVRPDIGVGLYDFWEDKDITAEEVYSELKGLLEDPTVYKTAHNSKFDMRDLLYEQGIDVKNLQWDTMCAAYLMDENRRHGLKELKNKFTDLLGYEDQWVSETGGASHPEKAYLSTISNYCCGDCDATYRLTKEQRQWFIANPIYMEFMSAFYVPLNYIIRDMEWYGVLYDVERAKALSAVYLEKMATIKQEACKYAGCQFDPESPQQVQKVLFSVLGLSHNARTDTGQQQVNKKVLKDLSSSHAVPQLIIDYRHCSKMRSTYIEGFIESLDANNRLHIPINTIGTVTGRLSSEGLMNIPREEDIKSLIIAPPAHKLVCADLSQAEVRCFAHYANEEALRSAYDSDDIDVHCLVAAEVLGYTYEQFWSAYSIEQKGTKTGPFTDRRQAAKGTVFGLLYGRGSASIALEYGMDIKDAELFMAQFFARFANCKKWIDAIHKLIEQNGEVVNIFGRIRRIPSIYSFDDDTKAEAKRQAVNSIIQATASDITNRALINVWWAIKKHQLPVHLLFTVYDSIIIESPDEYVDPTKKLLKEIMEQKPHPDFSVKIRADLDVYQKWGIKDKK